MASDEKNQLLHAYAAGDVTWWSLRERGFDNYIEVLAGLGALGLRPPIAGPGGANAEARERGRMIVRAALKVRSV